MPDVAWPAARSAALCCLTLLGPAAAKRQLSGAPATRSVAARLLRETRPPNLVSGQTLTGDARPRFFEFYALLESRGAGAARAKR